MTATIRIACDADASTVADLLRERDGAAHPPAAVTAYLADLDPSRITVWLAEKDGRPVGINAVYRRIAVALNRTARPSLRDRRPCDKPSRPEAATQAAWSRTVFPYVLPTRFQFTVNQDSRQPTLRDLHPPEGDQSGPDPAPATALVANP